MNLDDLKIIIIQLQIVLEIGLVFSFSVSIILL